jgi:hypothetical protein
MIRSIQSPPKVAGVKLATFGVSPDHDMTDSGRT